MSAQIGDMELHNEDEALRATVHRLRRAQEQIAGVIRMLEGQRDYKDVIVQVSAVSRALDRAGFAIIADALAQCFRSGNDQADVEELEKLFLSLA